MPGDLRQVRVHLSLVQSLDRVRRGGVQAPLLLSAELSGHRRADQRVVEPLIAGAVAGHQEPRRPAFFHRTEQGQHRHRLAGTLLNEHTCQLPYQERVASRLRMHLVGLLVRRGQPGGEEHVADRVGRQATQVHPLGVGIGRKARQEPGARVGGRSRAPVGRDDQDGRSPQLAHHIGEQGRRRLVRPLQIIEYQQEAAGSAASASRRRTSANSANRWALLESASPARAGRSASPNTADHRSAGRGCQRPGRRARPGPPATGRRAANCPGRPPGPSHRHTPSSGQRGSLLRRRVFPTPASPVHSTRRPRPARASSRYDMTRASSRSRPTIIWDGSPSTAPP